jgi:hypothetical protein
VVDPTVSFKHGTCPNRAGAGERGYPDHLSDFEREPWEQVKMLQISHLEFVLARILCRVELRKASVGEGKKARAESRSTLSTAGASRVLKVKRPLGYYASTTSLHAKLLLH